MAMRSLSFVGFRSIGCMRLKVRRFCVSFPPFIAEVMMFSTNTLAGSSSRRFDRRSSPAPVIVERILLMSCAMPPESCPIASIFWACKSCCSSFFLSVTSRSIPLYTMISPFSSRTAFTVAFAMITCPSFLTRRHSKSFTYPLPLISSLNLRTSSLSWQSSSKLTFISSSLEE